MLRERQHNNAINAWFLNAAQFNCLYPTVGMTHHHFPRLKCFPVTQYPTTLTVWLTTHRTLFPVSQQMHNEQTHNNFPLTSIHALALAIWHRSSFYNLQHQISLAQTPIHTYHPCKHRIHLSETCLMRRDDSSRQFFTISDRTSFLFFHQSSMLMQ